MTDKHAAECPEAAYLDIINLNVIYTPIEPEVSVSLTKFPFLFAQVKAFIRAFEIRDPLMCM